MKNVHRSRKNVWNKYEFRSRLIEIQQDRMAQKTLKSHQNSLLLDSATEAKKALALFLTLKRFRWNSSIWDILKEKWLFEMLKFHGVLTSCRVKRAPHSAAFPNLVSKAYESVSECSQRPYMEEKRAKSYALQKCYRMWWKMLNNFYVPSISKATFYCWRRTTVNSKRKFRPKTIAGLRARSWKTWHGAPLFNVSWVLTKRN